MGLAVGNILGSCVTNLTLVLGTAAVINPLSISAAVFDTSMTFLLGITMFLWYQIHKGGIMKTGAVAMILAYILFILVEAGIVSLPLS
jgi:cation:H+ antiporter